MRESLSKRREGEQLHRNGKPKVVERLRA